jgi:hypothetical protein
MNINFDNPTTISIVKSFDGETPNGNTFTIYAEWNDWDDWTVDRIEWDKGYQGTDDEEYEITDVFSREMNG